MARPTKRGDSVDCLGLGIMPLDLLFQVRRMPRSGAKIDAQSLTVQGGGPVPNVLVGLSRLGLGTSLITAVAEDAIGQQGLAEVRAEGVDTTHVVTRPGASDTAAGLIEASSGERTMILNRQIHVRPRDVVPAKLPTPRVVHLDGRDLDACMKLARWGRKVGAAVCFDVGSMRNDVSPIFPLVDHLVVADAYALPFTHSRTSRQAVRRLLEYGPSTVVVTEGTNGSVGFTGGQWVRQAAFRVKAVDTTGAGDAYHTGYLLGLLDGCPLAERMKLGAAVAALKCTAMGARTGLPTRVQLNRFLKDLPKSYD